MTSSILSETYLANKTGKAPAPVARPATKLAKKPILVSSALGKIGHLSEYHPYSYWL